VTNPIIKSKDYDAPCHGHRHYAIVKLRGKIMMRPVMAVITL
jgi:hypothetical protein